MALTLGITLNNFIILICILLGLKSGHLLSALPSSSLSNDQYVALSAYEKREYLWENGILETEFPENQLPAFQDIKIFKLLFGMMNKKMDHTSDFSPKGWEKAIHRRAVVAKVRYVPELNHSYTGLLSEETLGLLRVSLTYCPDKRGVSPGMALKLFIDKNVSRDVSLLTGLDSHGQDYNFFSRTFSNIVPLSNSLGAKLVSKIFKRASSKTNFISIHHLAEMTPDAKFIPVNQRKHPYQIFVKASSSINFPSLPKRDIRLDFMGLKPDLDLLEIYARPQENTKDYSEMTKEKFNQFEKQAVKIGTIVLESNFIASAFGDDLLFFRHERF
jgi:hypothetical protein